MANCLNTSNKEIAKLVKDFGEVTTSKLLDNYFPNNIPVYEEFIKNKNIQNELGIIPISKVKSELNKSYPKELSNNRLTGLKKVISILNNKLQGYTYQLFNINQIGQSDNYTWGLRKIAKNVNIQAKLERAKNRIVDSSQNLSEVSKLEELNKKQNNQLGLFDNPSKGIFLQKNQNEVNFTLKSIDILSSDKAKQIFEKGKKAGWDLNKILTELQIPKEQKQLILDLGITDREQIALELASNYSFAIEINTAKRKNLADEGEEVLGNPDENTQYYSNLTVPGGTNYTENEIATPLITPSIKGHAQFSTDNGIGWFRSDEQMISEYPVSSGTNIIERNGKWIVTAPEIGDIDSFNTREEAFKFLNSETTKTRRILEIQSDLFQKGRDKKVLTKGSYKGKDGLTYEATSAWIQKPGEEAKEIRVIKSEKYTYGETFTPINSLPQDVLDYFKTKSDTANLQTDNQFLQLLNKNNNWVTFFVKSIIQDSAKKGYEKILFPTGNTASKVEGHTTLEEFKRGKEDRIKELENSKGWKIKANEGGDSRTFTNYQEAESFKNKFPDVYTKIYEVDNSIEINQLKQELERVETEGFGALKPIYNFYENTVTNILNKTYGKDNVKLITDEYGNTWNEITINEEVKDSVILLQKENSKQSVPSENTIGKVKELLIKWGVSISNLNSYAKKHPEINIEGVNALADLINGVIAIVEGKEDVSLTEEMIHIATAIIEAKNPGMITEMISKIGRFQIYKDTLEQYKNDKNYQLPNGKPDIRKIKKEAVDKLIAELFIYNNQGDERFPELANETDRSLVRRIWESILDFFRGEYRKANIDIFQEASSIISEGNIGNVNDIQTSGVYFQLSQAQKDFQQRVAETRNSVFKVEYEQKSVDPLLMDSEEATNGYVLKTEQGEIPIVKRVTDRVKAWYKQRFGNKVFTEEEKKFNEFKRIHGVRYHGYFEEIHSRYFDNSTGVKNATVGKRPVIENNYDNQIYSQLETYFVELIDSYTKDEIAPLVFSEMIVYDPLEKEAGTLDLVIVDSEGTTHVHDWKFMTASENQDDVAWYKQGAYNIQLGRYKKILQDFYGVEKIGKNRAIPILMKMKVDKKTKNLVIGGITIGSVDASKITDLKLAPVSEKTESTGISQVDKLITELNALYDTISNKKAFDDNDKDFKRERLNAIRKTIRSIQPTLQVNPLIDLISIMRKEGSNIINDYKLIYENADPLDKTITNKQRSDFADSLRDYLAIAELFGRIDDTIAPLLYNVDMEKTIDASQKEQLARQKELSEQIIREAKEIRDSYREIREISGQFADKFIGIRNLVSGLLENNIIIKGLGSKFAGLSELATKSPALAVLFKMITNSKAKAAKEAQQDVKELLEIQQKLLDRGETIDLIQSLYQNDNDKFINQLVDKYDKKFREELEANAKEGKRSKEWILDNIDIDAYNEDVKRLLDIKIKNIQRTYSDESIVYDMIEKQKQFFDINRIDFNGYNNYLLKRYPQQKWISKEYKNIEKDADLLSLYNFILKMNNKAAAMGYIENNMKSIFLPFVRKSTAENMAWDFNVSPINNWVDSMKVRPDDIGYGNINALTKEVENTVPKYYTYDFSKKEDGTIDTSQVSKELFKNMILYINHMNQYKNLTDVEGQLNLVKKLETFKQNVETNSIGQVQFENGVPKVSGNNEKNTKLYDVFLRALMYDQKYPLDDSDIPLYIGDAINFIKNGVTTVTGIKFKNKENSSPTSMIKIVDGVNKWYVLKTLGFEFLSGAANLFGTALQLSTQSGAYFKAREVVKNGAFLVKNKFTNEQESQEFMQLVDIFMPLKEHPNHDKLQKAGLTKLTKYNYTDMLMVFMRMPELLVEKSIFLTLLKNTMIVNGKLVNIKEHVQSKYPNRNKSAEEFARTKKLIEDEISELQESSSIYNTKKIENGKLVIPGLDLNNFEEIQKLTNLTRTLSRNATGSLSESDLNTMSMNIWSRSAMVFKSWIPKLVATRFGEFRKVTDDFSVELDEYGNVIGEKYDIGRIRLFAYVLGTSIKDKSSNITNILKMNEKGILKIDEIYAEYANSYKLSTGKDLKMTKDEFTEMIRTNLRNQIKEFIIFITLLSLAKFATPDEDDDDNKAEKNAKRFVKKTLDRFIGELQFFYNPFEIQNLLSGNVFPAIGLFNDIERFIENLFMETTGLDLSNPDLTYEEVLKKAQPIKYGSRLFPFTKSLLNYGAMFDEEIAKDFDITIQKTNRK